MRLLLLAALILTAACGRPLTPRETAVAAALSGGTIDPGPVRFHEGHPFASYSYTRPIRPRLTCQERLFPPSRGETVELSPGAIALFQRVLWREDLYREDFFAEMPEVIDLYSAMLFAHEMTHVWQWQQRKVTGYHPFRAAAEHQRSEDPYLFDPDSTGVFADYGYEQQGSLVEEYVCCQVLDPEAPRTARLKATIEGAMDLSGLEALLQARNVRIPWSGAEVENICR
ncbi:hypothetical protein LR948_08450 [Roseivivax sp. GX 12232]|uniref:hypothetical protein n=1 Tax=Roseivivax sp. GX 12232 TaxID=2900547 RepID=UPI001E54FC14|nr:hypothetical protein [Roseivivax sp. GX 12232]MCE0505378.1 hypothetical protein [Roseivivax sp. GX 12232]